MNVFVSHSFKRTKSINIENQFIIYIETILKEHLRFTIRFKRESKKKMNQMNRDDEYYQRKFYENEKCFDLSLSIKMKMMKKKNHYDDEKKGK